jgi:hypothetical protein
MTKITYLFGAGASRKALPTINEIPDKLYFLLDFLKSDEFKLDSVQKFGVLEKEIEKPMREYQIEMMNDLEWLMYECRRHASVDTFAKKLFLKREYIELKRLKIALSIFFIFEQARNRVDDRYDTFYASILNNLIKLPENIRILSWNYDYQFEFAFKEYISVNKLSEIKDRLNIYEKQKQNVGMNDGFGIFKLNGSAGLFAEDGWENYLYIDVIDSPVDKDFIREITLKYVQAIYFDQIHSSLLFAWEKKPVNNNFEDNLIENIKDTYSLIVIGYSFPFFNREIDKSIINSMTNLRRVYFQSLECESIKERFQALRRDHTNIKLISRSDVGQFLLPNEL